MDERQQQQHKKCNLCVYYGHTQTFSLAYAIITFPHSDRRTLSVKWRVTRELHTSQFAERIKKLMPYEINTIHRIDSVMIILRTCVCVFVWQQKPVSP
jgi:hypothetical protein